MARRFGRAVLILSGLRVESFERPVRFIVKLFPVWVILFALLAFLLPDAFRPLGG